MTRRKPGRGSRRDVLTDGATSNVQLYLGNYINITGRLTFGADIGVTIWESESDPSMPGYSVFTAGYDYRGEGSANGETFPSAYFHSDAGAYEVGLNTKKKDSGEGETLEAVRPLLEAMGRTIVHIGPVGAGQVAKACNQILTGVGVAAVAEALNFATRSGVDAARVREALLGGFAYSRILENHGQRMLERNFKPGFKAWMHQKDLRIVTEEAHRLGLALPASAATAQLFNAVVGSGMGEDDSIAMLRLLERMSGAEE